MTPLQTNRLPPHCIESEQGILGCCLIDPQASLHQCLSQKVGDKFYDLRHQQLLESMGRMVEIGKPIDIVTLNSFLRDNNQLEAIGGQAYISALTDCVPSAANLDSYIETIDEKFYARKVIQKTTLLASELMESTARLDELTEKCETAIFSLRRQTIKKSSRVDSFDRIAAKIIAAQDGAPDIGLPTGFARLDRMLGGMAPATMIVLAARPGLGKSTLAMNIAEHLAVYRNTPVGCFSLEMTEDQMNTRSIASIASINMRHVNSGVVSPEDMTQIARAMTTLKHAPLFIVEDSDMDIHQIRSEGRRMVSEHGVKFIIIDYLQLVSGSSKVRNREERVGEVSVGVKKMAKELGIPVLAIASLNREVEKDSKRKPRLSDLRDSGSIESDADAVIFLSCEDEMRDVHGCVPIIASFAKNRNGPMGQTELLFRKEFSQFLEHERFMPEQTNPQTELL